MTSDDDGSYRPAAGSRPQAVRPVAVGQAGGVVLVGRAAELGLVRRLAGRVQAGLGGAVWVEGEPGIGKSALIAAGLAASRGRGCQVYAAAADEQSPVFPLHVLLGALGADGDGRLSAGHVGADLVRASRAEIIGLLEGGPGELLTPRDMVPLIGGWLEALVHRLCAVSPVVLVVDNAQWADEASLKVLMRLASMLGQLPLLLVMAARPVPARPEVRAFREGLADAGGTVVELGPVSSAEAAEMVCQFVGAPPGPALAGQLAAAGGNPLFLRELIDALAGQSRLEVDDQKAELVGQSAGLPGTLPAVIARRLGFLSEPAMSALRVAAVLGPVFSAADLGIVTGRGDGELAGAQEALHAGVLAEPVPGTLAFRHGLVHQALYQGMPTSLRAALHRQAAESLALAGAQADRVAMHLLGAPAEGDSWMVDWMAAAAPTLSRRAPRVAAELLQRARDGLSWEDARRDRLDADLAMAWLMLGDNDRAMRLARPVLAGTRDPALAGRAAWTLGYALPRLGRLEEAVELTGQALARAGLPPVWSARLRARRATSLFKLGHYDAARSEAQRAETEGTLADDRLAVGYALYTLARLDIIAHGTLTAAARGGFERALTVLGEEPDATDLVLQLMVTLGGLLGVLGLPADADRMYAQAAALVEQATPPRQAHVRSFSATFAFHRGRWDDALAELDAAAQLTPDAIYRWYLHGVGAQVALHRDDRAAADEYLRGAAEILPADGELRIEVEYLLVAWALAAERDGEPAEALTRLRAIFDPGATLKFSRLGMLSTQWLPDVVRLALTIRKPAIAAAAADACTLAAEAQARPPVTAAARHCRGLLDRDPAALTAAAESFQSIGYPLFSAQALENAAVLHAENGDAAAARVAYLQAVVIYNDLGATWDITRADARLRQHNIRRGRRAAPRRPATGWESLTSTEQKIARLVAEGQSNPDIAVQLMLSLSTVKSHVSHILTKLHARSRFEIARTVTKQDHREHTPRRSLWDTARLGRVAVMFHPAEPAP